jgi:hypothetical protein
MGVLRSQYRALLIAALEVLAIAFCVWALMTHFFPAPRFALATIGYPGMWARVLPMFLVGMLLATVRDRLPVNGWIALACLAALAIAARIPYAWPPALAIAGAYLLFCSAYTPSVRLWRATSPGDPSYGMYLLSFPIQQLIVRHYTHGNCGEENAAVSAVRGVAAPPAHRRISKLAPRRAVVLAAGAAGIS